MPGVTSVAAASERMHLRLACYPDEQWCTATLCALELGRCSTVVSVDGSGFGVEARARLRTVLFEFGTLSGRSDNDGVMEGTDAEAIRASLSDGEAFLPVVERHLTEISRYLRRRIGRDAADDLTEEVFTTAFARRRSYDLSRPSALPWLYGIASNLLQNQRRRELRELRALARVGVDPLISSGDPADRAFGTAFEPALADALLGLTPQERDVLLLFAWGDLGYGEIAEALGVRIGTVKSRLSRARTHVRTALAAHVDEEVSCG
jgi:RNA polymerase sigma-70 factor (ECF subfamily)